MSLLPGRLGLLTARDVMTRDVITLKDTDSIEVAIGRFREHHITGAPVADANGKFVGILSLTDLARSAPIRASDSEAQSLPLAHGMDKASWDLFASAVPVEAAVRTQTVRERMSRRVKFVSQKTSIVEVARVMCGGHWHRVPVVDEHNTLCGIISTMDILAAVVNVADEPE
ncbi:MAG: CBS domain-containing protein [Planctomycetaceae bacterium]